MSFKVPRLPYTQAALPYFNGIIIPSQLHMKNPGMVKLPLPFIQAIENWMDDEPAYVKPKYPNHVCKIRLRNIAKVLI